MMLIVTSVFPPEPLVSANLSRDIAQELASQRYDVTVVSPKPTRPYGKKYNGDKMSNTPYSHCVLESYTHPKSSFLGRLFESISFGRATKKFIRENHDQIKRIYANTWPIFAQYFLVKEANRFNIPVIMHVQDVYPESYAKKIPKSIGGILTSIIMPIERYIMSRSSKVIAISEDMKKYLVNSRPLAENNAYVVRNWQDDDFLSKTIPQNEEPDTRFTFLYAGSVSVSAGVDLLIKSFGDLGTRKNCRLVIAGSGSNRAYCEKLAKDIANIEFWDAPFEQIPEIQAKADVLLLSLKEGVGKTATPSKFTAYLFAKKPVLASIDEDCDTANMIRSANCGFVVPPEDETALRQMMEKILETDPGELHKMGEKGFLFAQQNLSKRVNLDKIVNILVS